MTQQPKSNKQQSGRYIQGGRVEDFGTRLGWWERKVFPTSPTDVVFELPTKYNMRPDLLAYDLYGQATLQWFILQYNVLSDVVDFVPGVRLVLPTRSRLFSELLSNRG